MWSPVTRVALIFLLAIPAMFLNGWTVSVLADWFLNLDLNTAQGIGLTLIVGLLTHDVARRSHSDMEWWESMLTIYLAPIITLAIGAAVYYTVGGA